MPLNFSARETRAMFLIGLLGLVILWVYLTYLIVPLQHQAADLQQQVQAAREKMRGLEAATANATATQEQYRQLEKNVESFRAMLPPEEELPAVIALITDLASQAQVKIQTIFPQRAVVAPQPSLGKIGADQQPPSEPSALKDILIQVDAVAGYHQLGTFLGLIESQPKPMRVASLRISANPRESKRHLIKLLIRASFTPSGTSAAAEDHARGYASTKP